MGDAYNCTHEVDNSTFREITANEKFAKLDWSNDEGDKKPKMYFSWENKERFEEVMTYSEDIISKTDILIIIGYSFPSLNRNTDKRLLELLSSDAKIYIQCGSEKDFLEIQSKIEALSNHKHGERHLIATLTTYSNISFIPQNKEFYVPYEF